MTSIPSSPAPAPAPPAASDSASGGAGKTPESAGESGFMALIDALLQGSTLPADAATPFDAAADPDATEDSTGEDDVMDLLAGLGFAPALPNLAPPPVPPPDAGSGAAALRQGRVALDAGLLAPAGDADAQSLLADDALFAAVADVAGGDAAASSREGPDGTQNLNAWAGVAHRVAAAQADSAPEGATYAGLREDVGTARWRDELGARITLMATQGQQSGSLRLSPEHLGPLEIEITVNDDKTTHVQFGAQHAETRAALQDALPRLREMFSTAGLTLGDAGVNGHAPRQAPAEGPRSRFEGSGGRDGEPSPPPRPVRSITHSGLLDTYA